MDDPLETRTLSDYLRVLKARRRLILTITLIAAGAALLFSLARPPVYEATATISFTTDFFPQGQPAAPGQPSAPAVATGAELMTREDVLKATSQSLDGDPTAEELESQVVATVEPTSNLVTLKATGDTAEEAATIANEVAKQTQTVATEEVRAFAESRLAAADPEQRSDLRRRIKTLEPVDIVGPAVAPESASSPKPVRDTVIAAFLGLLIGIGAAFVRHSVDRRISDPHEMQDELGLPLVGYVRGETLGIADLSSNGATVASEDDLEAFRILRANVDFLAKDQSLGTVAVTSPLPEEGKSTVAAGYAYANALAGRLTILLECDFRRPVMAERFGFDPSPGLSDYLVGDARPRDVLRSVNVEGPTAQPLPVIPAGVGAVQPAELLASPGFEQFLAQIAKAYERVVIDCAPLLPVGDALEVLPQVEGVLLCLRVGQTTRDQARAANEAMSHLPDRPTGLVITGLQRGDDDDYYGYYSATGPTAPGVAAEERG